MYANIIVDISHEQLDKTFQYHVPDALLSQIDTGVMVNIPFGRGNRIITGYVIELTSKAEFDEERIKDIDSVVPNRVKAVEDMIKLAAWLKHNYGGTMNQALKTVIPVKEKIRQKEKKHIKLNVTKEEAKANGLWDIYADLWKGEYSDEGCVIERPKMLYNDKTKKMI